MYSEKYLKGRNDVARNDEFERLMARIEHRNCKDFAACDICKSNAMLGLEKLQCHSNACVIRQGIVALAEAGYTCYYNELDDILLQAVLTNNIMKRWNFSYYYRNGEYWLVKSSFDFLDDEAGEEYDCIPVFDVCKKIGWLS